MENNKETSKSSELKFGSSDTGSSDIGQNLSLPADHPATDSLLARKAAPTGSPVLVYYGCPVWGHKDWKGRIYPPDTPEKDFLEAYAKQFNAIELNATYYKLPDESTLLRWRSQVHSDFRFCPKFPRQISHTNQLENCRNLSIEFINRMHSLDENLGDFFLQLPPAFGPEKLDLLAQFLDDLPGRLPLHVELRHPGWFANETIFTSLGHLLESTETGLVITDSPGRRDAVHMRLSNMRPMIRFAGLGDMTEDKRRLEAWAKRVNSWINSGVRTLWFFAHEPEETFSPDLADLFLEQLSEVSGLEMPRIKFVSSADQMELF